MKRMQCFPIDCINNVNFMFVFPGWQFFEEKHKVICWKWCINQTDLFGWSCERSLFGTVTGSSLKLILVGESISWFLINHRFGWLFENSVCLASQIVAKPPPKTNNPFLPFRWLPARDDGWLCTHSLFLVALNSFPRALAATRRGWRKKKLITKHSRGSHT